MQSIASRRRTLCVLPLVALIYLPGCGDPEPPDDADEVEYVRRGLPDCGAKDPGRPGADDVSPDTIGRPGPAAADVDAGAPPVDPAPETQFEHEPDPEATPDEEAPGAPEDSALSPWIEDHCEGVDDCSFDLFPEAVLEAHGDCDASLACLNNRCMVYCPPDED